MENKSTKSVRARVLLTLLIPKLKKILIIDFSFSASVHIYVCRKKRRTPFFRNSPLTLFEIAAPYGRN